MPEFKLPDLGEGVTEAEIDRWLVSEGQEIDEDTPLVEVITDKATAEIPSPYAGVVAKIHVGTGEVVPVGTTLVTVMNSKDFASPGSTGAGAQVVDAHPEAAPGPPEDLDRATRSGATRSQTAPSQEEKLLSRPDRNRGNGRVRAMPPVRKLARALGVDLGSLTGSGPGGRILREDVEAAAGGTQPAAARSAPPRMRLPAGGKREPLRGIRRKISENLSAAHRIVPPVTHVEDCDVTELEATRKLANERSGEGSTKLTFIPFIVKAVARTLQDYPYMNSSLDEGSQEIVLHDRYDIGVAVDTDGGLVVPVVRDAHIKTIPEIAADVDRLAGAAREGRLTSDELKDGTFTVTSPGKFGGLMATPIIFHPQAAILGVHRAEDRPVVRGGQIVIRKMMNLSITFDHRLLDGLTAARFCLEVVDLLEHPAVLLLES